MSSYAVEPLDTEDLQHQQSDDEETEAASDSCQVKPLETQSPLYVLPLYSILPFKEQEKVFKPPPTGSRLCVVATNVAETSITIPGLKYVVDSGKVKKKVYSENGGISQFQIHWCSKASANQRAGRCGRTEGGHCYRLYSSAVFQEFDDFTKAEIETIPVDDVLLQMKALGIDRVVQFPFPTPPDPEALKSAEKRLVTLGALQDLSSNQTSKDERKKWEYSAKVTPLGKAMSRFPLSPRYAKMLLLSYKHKCIPYMVAIVCAFTVPELFVTSTVRVETEDGDEEVKVVQEGIQKFAPGTGVSARLGDVMVLLQAVASFENSRQGVKFCFRNGIHYKAMSEIHKMGIQLLREMNKAFPDANLPTDLRMDPPSTEQVENMRAIVAACLIDNVARKLSREETKDDKNLKNAYQCLNSEKPVFIHPSSTLFSKLPEWVVCNEMKGSAKRASNEATGNTLETPDETESRIKIYMKGVVEIEAEWLAAFFPNLCEFSKPSENPPPRYNSENGKIYCHIGGTFGSFQWNLPVVSMEMPRGEQKFTLFCFFLLDGQICPFFNNYKSHYLSSPSIMMKNWAGLLPRTRYLLNAVKEKSLDSRESLRKVWEADPKYLLREFREWLPVDKHTEVELQWPPKL